MTRSNESKISRPDDTNTRFLNQGKRNWFRVPGSEFSLQAANWQYSSGRGNKGTQPKG